MIIGISIADKKNGKHLGTVHLPVSIEVEDGAHLDICLSIVGKDLEYKVVPVLGKVMSGPEMLKYFGGQGQVVDEYGKHRTEADLN